MKRILAISLVYTMLASQATVGFAAVKKGRAISSIGIASLSESDLVAEIEARQAALDEARGLLRKAENFENHDTRARRYKVAKWGQVVSAIGATASFVGNVKYHPTFKEGGNVHKTANKALEHLNSARLYVWNGTKNAITNLKNRFKKPSEEKMKEIEMAVKEGEPLPEGAVAVTTEEGKNVVLENDAGKTVAMEVTEGGEVKPLEPTEAQKVLETAKSEAAVSGATAEAATTKEGGITARLKGWWEGVKGITREDVKNAASNAWEKAKEAPGKAWEGTKSAGRAVKVHGEKLYGSHAGFGVTGAFVLGLLASTAVKKYNNPDDEVELTALEKARLEASIDLMDMELETLKLALKEAK
ncbi:MAG: hypothetical protein AB7F43_05335 [Bacteriovoracia bacterium]